MTNKALKARLRAIEERLGEDANQDNADAKWLLGTLLKLRRFANQIYRNYEDEAEGDCVFCGRERGDTHRRGCAMVALASIDEERWPLK